MPLTGGIMNTNIITTEHDYLVGSEFCRISQDTLKQLREYGACIVSDALKGFNVMDSRIRSIVPGKTICGCALTVRLRPGDNLMLHKAIEISQPGDVLVIDTGCNYRNAVIGGIMSEAAFRKGIGGLVVDGAVRDVEELRENGYAVFAGAIVPNTGDSDGPGMLNVPISCGNVPVLPGDIVIADDNGVAVVPQSCLDLVLSGCEKKISGEKKRITEIRNGQLTSSAIIEKLKKAGLYD